MLDIVLPNEPNSDFSVPLNGTVLTINLSYNSRDKNWRIGISYAGVRIFYPETLKPNTFLFQNQDENVLGGVIFCHPLTDEVVITRDNLFTSFALRFYTLEELEV